MSNSTFYNAVELEMAYYFSLSKINLGKFEKYMTAQKIVRPFFITAVHCSIIKLSYEKDVFFLYPCHFWYDKKKLHSVNPIWPVVHLSQKGIIFLLSKQNW